MPVHNFTLSRRLAISLSIISLTAIALTYNASQIMLPGRANYLTATSTLPFPDPTIDSPASRATEEQTIIFAGGCFWGVEAVFEHVQGVSDVVSGYSGGSEATAHYEEVGSGATGHAEAVSITYDPSQISYGQLLKVYFSVAHDPTQLNRQGPDSGTQYRSAIFYANDEQQQVAQAYMDQLNAAQIFNRPIVTQLSPLNGFYAAEEYHQNFIDRNPNYPYVVVHDLPKLNQLREQFPDLYQE
jgi:peptide-methionine (S)-S-oxide reductase